MTLQFTYYFRHWKKDFYTRKGIPSTKKIVALTWINKKYWTNVKVLIWIKSIPNLVHIKRRKSFSVPDSLILTLFSIKTVFLQFWFFILNFLREYVRVWNRQHFTGYCSPGLGWSWYDTLCHGDHLGYQIRLLFAILNLHVAFIGIEQF